MGLFAPLPTSEAAEQPLRPPRPTWVGPPEARFAVVLPDGTVATTLHARRHVRYLARPDSAPPGPRLSVFLGGMRGGGPGDERVLHIPAPLWLWPAPPAAEFELVVEWPAYGVPETRTRVDGAQLADAASHAGAGENHPQRCLRFRQFPDRAVAGGKGLPCRRRGTHDAAVHGAGHAGRAS